MSMDTSMNTSINNAYIYCRISSQYSKKTNSLDTQEGTCISYCKDNDMNIVEIVRNKKSSRNMMNYDELEKLIEKMKPNDTLVVADVSRFSRNLMKGLQLLDKMDKKKIKIYAVKEQAKYDTFTNRYTFRNFLNHAEYETDGLSMRINDSIRNIKQKGGTLGGAKFGYEKYIDNGIRKIRKNMTEHRTIMKIRKMFREGKTPQEIANELNNFNILYRGKRWTSKYITYVGKANSIC